MDEISKMFITIQRIPRQEGEDVPGSYGRYIWRELDGLVLSHEKNINVATGPNYMGFVSREARGP